MSEIVNKKFRLKSEPNSAGKRVVSVDNNVVMFSDNGRVSLDSFYDRFIEVLGESPNAGRTIIPDSTPIVNEHKNINNLQNNNFDNVESFFESEQNNLCNVLLNNFNKARSGEYTPQDDNYQEQDSYEEPLINSGAIDYNNLEPDTLNNLRKQQQLAEQRKKQKEIAKQNDPWFKNNFPNMVNENDEEIIKINTENYREDLEMAKYSNEHKVSVDKIPTSKSKSSISGKEQTPIQSLLGQMRNSKSVEINIKLNEMIPKIDDIKKAQSIFVDLPIVEYFAERIADKYLNDRDTLVGKIIEELEKMIKPRPSRKVTKKKIVKKKAPVKKVIKDETDSDK